jgi:hypothetical protein
MHTWYIKNHVQYLVNIKNLLCMDIVTLKESQAEAPHLHILIQKRVSYRGHEIHEAVCVM